MSSSRALASRSFWLWLELLSACLQSSLQARLPLAMWSSLASSVDAALLSSTTTRLFLRSASIQQCLLDSRMHSTSHLRASSLSCHSSDPNICHHLLLSHSWLAWAWACSILLLSRKQCCTGQICQQSSVRIGRSQTPRLSSRLSLSFCAHEERDSSRCLKAFYAPFLNFIYSFE